MDHGSDIIDRVLALEAPLRENLLTLERVAALQNEFLTHLDAVFSDDSLPSLRYQKERRQTHWTTVGTAGYPAKSEWPWFERYINMVGQARVERTVKQRAKVDGLWFETRSQGEDLHVLVGHRDGTPGKAHVIADAKTGEIRVEDNQMEPTDLVRKIEVMLHLGDGRKILTTREAIELLSTDDR